MQKKKRTSSGLKWSETIQNLKRFTGRAALGGGLLIAGCLSPGIIKAQTIINNYNFAASAGTFTPLGASATQVTAMEADTYVMPAAPIGFTFNFDGVDYTQFRANSNGLFSFNPSATTSSANDLEGSTAATRPLLAPLWDNLDGRATGGSKASYEVTGAPGAQIFTFEWLNWEFNATSSAPVISFQVKLYEGTNKIEFVYRPESGAVNSGSASVGIAGVGTGPGNFLSVSELSTTPTISYVTETTNISNKPASQLLYTFTRVAPSALDITTTGLVSPVAAAGCISPNQTVTVSIKNNGTAPIDFATTPATVTASAKLGTTTTNFPAVTVNTGTLAPGASQNVTITTSFPLTTAGTYTFDATTIIAGDGRTINDTMPTASVTFTGKQVISSLPQLVEFTGFTGTNLGSISPGWSEASGATGTGTTSNWTDDDFANVSGGSNGTAARITLNAASDNVWLVSPKISATASTALKFDLALTVAAATTAGTLGSDDQLQVMVSTDCGVTYTPIQTYSATTPISNTGQSETISLATYAGQDIVVALFATEGTSDDTENNDLFIDNIFLGTPPSLDLGATVLMAPVTTGCYTANQMVTVAIENFGPNAVDFSVNPVTVTVNVSGAVTQVIDTTLTSGTLASGATLNVNVGTLNMTTAGTYTFAGGTTLTGDGNPANNNFVTATRTVTPIAASPQAVDFTGYTGSNLSTVFPGWYEADGIVPAGTTSSWVDDDFANVTGHANGAAANINLNAASDNDWIIGPKVAATATTSLKFDLALTNDNLTTAATMGSDDALIIMVSTDCGITFTPVRTYNASTPISNTGQTETVSLAAFAGQNIIVGFYATEGTVDDSEDNDLFIDNIFLGTPPSIDMGVTALVSPMSGNCFSATEPVIVTIQNFGPNTMDFTVIPVTVTVNVTGAVTQPLTSVINTGTLASGATMNVNVGNLNMSANGTYTFNGMTTTTGDGNPANNNLTPVTIFNGVITSFPTVQDFETFTPIGGMAAGNAGWTGSTTGIIWEVEESTSGSSGTGPAVDHTLGTTAGNYVFLETSTGAAGDVAELVTPCINLAGQNGIGMEFWYHMFGATIDTLKVDVFNGTAWVNNVFVIGGQQQFATTDPWKKAVVNLSPYNGNLIKVRFRGKRGNSFTGDIAIDDVRFFQLPAVELSVTGLTLPNSSCGLTATETVCINITNNGSTAATGFPVNYTVNGGAAVTETVAASIAPGATVQYCFTTKVNLATNGTYTIVGSVNATGDADVTNNSLTGATTAVPTIASFPYFQDFESGNGSWRASGINSSWALGTPAGTLINSAASGTNAWVTNLIGNHPNNEQSAVVGPCFNFTSIPNPMISMKIFWDIEDDWDGAVLQSSIDNGATWQLVGTFGDPNNWYNSDSIDANPGNQPLSLNGAFVGWSGTGTAGSGGWVTASHALTGLGGQPSVQLRIAFASDGATVEEGFAFDDISISNMVAVPTVTAGGPTTFCQGGSVVLTAATTTPGATFTWELNGSPVAGATSNTYTATASGSYTAIANSGGTATSAPTVITVNPAAATPTVTAASPTTFCTGGSVALTAASTTTGATYQWFLNGTAIPAATAATYMANAAGSYTVVATANGCPSTASTATTVTINAAPATPTISQNGGILTSSAATGNQWYLNGTIIAGATGQTYTTAANGNYTVVTTANGCPSASSAVLNMTKTGAADALAGMSIQVYPNPTKGSFNVKLNGYQKEAAVSLYNLAGQLIATDKVAADGQAKNIDIKGLAAGTYLLKVTSDKGVQVNRLIVQ